jgi:glycosyltransferase involved in cell wall biosynthesis
MSVTIVIPCFNERARFSQEQLRRLVHTASTRVVLVDDGSTDGTWEMLQALCRQFPGRTSPLRLAHNSGKAEAVRRGMLAALADGCDVVGYLDADFATPADEMVRLVRTLQESSAEVALASRVGLLGTRIERRMPRHYLGRVFATFASLILDLRVYDTQCGAKAFRASPLLRNAISEPFHARWAFDVELIGRLLAGSGSLAGLSAKDFIEMPLRSWTDMGGSQLTPMHYPLLAWELVRIRFVLERLRRRPSAARVLRSAARPEESDAHKDVA